MKLKCCFLLLLYFGIPCSRGVNAKNDHTIKRGMHPFMAFIYYSDPLVVDVSGQRFVRSAVLIRPDWLVTTAIGPSLMDPSGGFPKKTLLARAGAITIDLKLTLNEDEDEQEREIVQIVRPYNHSATQWWTTDISLMKTLIPFNLTSAVGIKTLNIQHSQLLDSKTCSILVYVKKYTNGNSNDTEDKILMLLYVDMIRPSIGNCGNYFTAGTMACATESDDNRDAMYDPDFCQGNSGGPLICDNEVIGLQTYIENDCKQPHLYQLLYAWDNFITCGIEDKCKEETCSEICDVIYKDPPKAERRITLPVTQDTARDLVTILNVPSTTISEATVNTIDTSVTVTLPSVRNVTMSAAITSNTTPNEAETEAMKLVNISEVTKSIEIELTPDTTVHETAMSSVMVETSLITETVEKSDNINIWNQQAHTKQTWPKVNEASASESDTETIAAIPVIEPLDEPKPRAWPKETKSRENFKEEDGKKRRTNVEAQQHAPETHKHSVSDRNMCVFQTVLFGFVVLLCL